MPNSRESKINQKRRQFKTCVETSLVAKAEPVDEFERLLRAFPGARAAAQNQVSRFRNEDIKMAIVGFSYHHPAENWTRDNSKFIRRRCRGELSDAALSWHGDAAPAFRSFACLALGTLLGLRASQQLDEAGFALGDAQLPGFMYAHLPEIDGQDAA